MEAIKTVSPAALFVDPLRAVARLWRRPKPQPIEPEETLAQLIERQKVAMLLAGGGTLHGMSNVACGTPGHALDCLERDGLMKSDMSRTDYGQSWTYMLTRAGKEARLMLLPD